MIFSFSTTTFIFRTKSFYFSILRFFKLLGAIKFLMFQMRDKAHGPSECICFEDGMFYLENERIWGNIKCCFHI